MMLEFDPDTSSFNSYYFYPNLNIVCNLTSYITQGVAMSITYNNIF